MKISFEKMEGLGNDFVMLDDRNGAIESASGGYPALASRLCSRHFGIGADGIILLLQASGFDAGFRIFNCDGSEAQMCGNGMRCFARYLFENDIVTKKKMSVDTRAGLVVPEVITDDSGRVLSVCVDIGAPILEHDKIPFTSPGALPGKGGAPGKSTGYGADACIILDVNGKDVKVTPVSMGNPHAVIFVDDVESAPVVELGALVEKHPAFPEKTNVEFIEVVSRDRLKMRVWERGVGETLACGTGACASLVAAVLNGMAEKKATLSLKHGDLEIEWRADNHLYKSGPATLVFKGNVEI